jgi:hypothetical protein
MKLVMESWRKFVLESSEQPLGKYVWPSAIKGHPMADEPDTDIEEILYKQLHNHFGAITPLSDEATTAMKQILDSGQYTHVFQRIPKGKALRGMRLPIAWLENYAPEALLSLPTERKDPLDWGPPIPIKPMTYKSKGKYGNASSWTYDWRSARRFTTMWKKETLPVILHTSMDSGYFMSTMPFKQFKGGRYKDEFNIKKLNPNAHEKEIILFGECTVTAVQIYATKKDMEKLR